LTAVPTDRHGRVHPPCSRENGGSEVARVDHQNLVLDQGRGAFQPSVTGLARTRARKCRMSMKAARLRGSGYVESSVAARLPNRRDWLGRRGRGFEACRSIQLSYGRTRKISEIANAYCSTTYGPDSQPQLPLIGCILRVGNRRFLDPRKSQPQHICRAVPVECSPRSAGGRTHHFPRRFAAVPSGGPAGD